MKTRQKPCCWTNGMEYINECDDCQAWCIFLTKKKSKLCNIPFVEIHYKKWKLENVSQVSSQTTKKKFF